MRKLQKFASLALCGALAVSMMAGCGGSGQKADSNAGANNAGAANGAETPSTEAPAADANNDAAPAGGTFKIGGIGPVTGGAAIYGSNVKNAGQIAVDEINAAGGINGYQIEYKFEDDEHDAEKAVNAYNSLKDWGMQLLLGTVTSTPCVAVAAETKNDNMYQITPSGSAVECVQYDNAFRVCFSDPDQGKASAQYIGQNKLATKVAVIYNSSESYSTGIYDSFKAEAANQGIEIVSAEAFTEESSSDFSVQIQKAKDGGAELLFLPIYYTPASLILKQADAIGYAPIFFGCDGLDGLLTLENFDTKLAEGVMLLTPFAADATDDKTVKFVTAYKEKFGGEIPNQFAADAYDGIYAIKAAIEKAGITPDMSVSDICEAMKKAMTEISVDGITGAGITWNANGEPTKEPKAVKIENGAYVMQ